MPLGDGNYIFFTVGVGHIWFTRRASDGSWVPAVREQNPQLPGDASTQAISTRGLAELQHVAIVASGGQLWHSLWNSQGQATMFGDVQATAAGQVGGFVDVDATHGPLGTPSSDELFVVGCNADGQLWDTTRHADGSWRPFENMQTIPGQINIGPIRNVACTTERPNGSGPAYHVVAVTDVRDEYERENRYDPQAYHLFHTRRDINTGAFSTFLDIESTAAGEAGNFTDVSCAWDGSSLHVCGVAGGTVKHTMRHADGTWTPFAEVKTLAASDPGLIEKVGCGVPYRLPPPRPVSTGCLTAAPVRVARRMLRRRQPDSLEAVAPAPLEVVVATSARTVWHTERSPTAAWTPFEDIEATAAGAIGSFAARPRDIAL
jgi:hypothetical protein